MSLEHPGGSGSHPHYAAPTGAGVDVSVPPQFPQAGPGPIKSVTGSEPQQVLGVTNYLAPPGDQTKKP